MNITKMKVNKKQLGLTLILPIVFTVFLATVFAVSHHYHTIHITMSPGYCKQTPAHYPDRVDINVYECYISPGSGDPTTIYVYVTGELGEWVWGGWMGQGSFKSLSRNGEKTIVHVQNPDDREFSVHVKCVSDFINY